MPCLLLQNAVSHISSVEKDSIAFGWIPPSDLSEDIEIV